MGKIGDFVPVIRSLSIVSTNPESRIPDYIETKFRWITFFLSVVENREKLAVIFGL